MNATLVGGVKIDNEERTKCEIWQRVMGYHRCVKDANIGKRQEHRDRKMFTENRTGRIIHGEKHCIGDG